VILKQSDYLGVAQDIPQQRVKRDVRMGQRFMLALPDFQDFPKPPLDE
jgi:hypothetical protein